MQVTEITRIEIFIWALIFSRFETARIMWKNSNESIGLALAGALFFRNVIKNSGENTGCLGKGFSFSENNNSWHHAVMTKKFYDQAKEELEAKYKLN